MKCKNTRKPGDKINFSILFFPIYFFFRLFWSVVFQCQRKRRIFNDFPKRNTKIKCRLQWLRPKKAANIRRKTVRRKQQNWNLNTIEKQNVFPIWFSAWIYCASFRSETFFFFSFPKKINYSFFFALLYSSFFLGRCVFVLLR